MAKTKAGTGNCACCGEGIVWKRADGGSYSYTCQHCDFRAYAPAHSDACKLIAAKIAPAQEPAKPEPVKAEPARKPAQKAEPGKAAEPAPAPAPKKKGLWFEGLGA